MTSWLKGCLAGFAMTALTSAVAGAAMPMPAPIERPQLQDAGFYVGINAGYGKFDIQAHPGFVQFNDDGFSWNGLVGYQFNRFLAVEGGYTQFHDAVGSSLSRTIRYTGLDLWSVLLKGMLPFNPYWSGFLKVGGGALRINGPLNTTGFPNLIFIGGPYTRWVPVVALGLTYHVTQNLALMAQAVTTFKIHEANTSDTPATYAGYLGATYLFNFM